MAPTGGRGRVAQWTFRTDDFLPPCRVAGYRPSVPLRLARRHPAGISRVRARRPVSHPPRSSNQITGTAWSKHSGWPPDRNRSHLDASIAAPHANQAIAPAKPVHNGPAQVSATPGGAVTHCVAAAGYKPPPASPNRGHDGLTHAAVEKANACSECALRLTGDVFCTPWRASTADNWRAPPEDN